MSTGTKKNLLNLPAGEIIDDRFEIAGNPLRRNFAVAYLAIDVKSQKRRTLLFLPPAITNDSEAMEYIRDEAKLIRWINHPFIARLYDLHSDGPFTYFELEYVRGKNLKEKKIANPQKRLSENITKWLGIQVLEALAYAHDQNILHRDIRPQNIVLTPDGKVKLIDFGISETLRFAVSMIRDISGQTSILYMSPEQVSGKQLSPQSDIYSVAATMYDLVSGKPPFFYGDVYTQILREEVSPITGVSADLNAILRKALAKEPLQRYASCKEMVKDLHISGVHYPEPLAATENKEKQKERQKKHRMFRFFSLNPTLKYLFWIVLLSGLLTVITFQFKKLSNFYFPSDSTSVEKILDSTQVKLVQALLKAANDKLSEGNLVQPVGNNALELFRKILEIQPQHSEANQQINNIKKLLLEKVSGKLKAGNPDEARALLNSAMQFFRDDKKLIELKKTIPAFTARIAVLNGNGMKGIAAKLARALEAKGFQTPVTENYRVRGRINWRVAKTRFEGKEPENEVIRNISAELGVKYLQVGRDMQFPSATNLIIVLGRDYRKIPAFRNR